MDRAGDENNQETDTCSFFNRLIERLSEHFKEARSPRERFVVQVVYRLSRQARFTIPRDFQGLRDFMDGRHRNWHCGASGADTRRAAFWQEVVSSDGLQVGIVWQKIAGL